MADADNFVVDGAIHFYIFGNYAEGILKPHDFWFIFYFSQTILHAAGFKVYDDVGVINAMSKKLVIHISVVETEEETPDIFQK
jgi:hypothetical protein